MRSVDTLDAKGLLPTSREVQSALGERARIDGENGTSGPLGVGSVIQAAAKDSAFRRFTGEVALPDGERPVTVSAMALIFDSAALAARTFDRVAEAAHLRAKLDGCDVAVETVTSTGGLVSYWGYVHRDAALVVLTLDTLDPQHISVADLRSLTRVAADRLEAGLTP